MSLSVLMCKRLSSGEELVMGMVSDSYTIRGFNKKVVHYTVLCRHPSDRSTKVGVQDFSLSKLSDAVDCFLSRTEALDPKEPTAPNVDISKIAHENKEALKLLPGMSKKWWEDKPIARSK